MHATYCQNFYSQFLWGDSMKTSRLASLLLTATALFSTITFAGEGSLNYGFKTAGYYSQLDEDLGLTLSNIFADYNSGGDASLADVLSGDSSFKDLNFEIKAKFSSLPYALEDSTREKLQAAVDEALPGMVDAAMAQNPVFASLPDPVVAGIRSQLITEATAEQYMKIDERIKQIQRETAFQELSFTTCGSFCVSFGKAKLYSTTHEYDEANALTTPDRAKTAGNVVGTGYVRFTQETEFKGYKAQVEVLVFKSRPNFYNASEYIAKTVNLNDADFDRTKDFHDIDSGALKFVLEGDNSISSIYLAKHAESDGVEVTVSHDRQLSEKDSVNVTAYHNSDDDNEVRNDVESALSLTYTHAFTDKLRASARAAKYWEQDNPYSASPSDKSDGAEFSLGVEYDLLKTERYRATFSYQRTEYMDDARYGDKSDNLFGFRFEAKF